MRQPEDVPAMLMMARASKVRFKTRLIATTRRSSIRLVEIEVPAGLVI
jgi:hypothetical protein